jgi:hypothetical protein
MRQVIFGLMASLMLGGLANANTPDVYSYKEGRLCNARPLRAASHHDGDEFNGTAAIQRATHSRQLESSSGDSRDAGRFGQEAGRAVQGSD